MDIIKQPMQSPDDAISLGSYEKYYKDLPAQFVMSNTNRRKVPVVSKPNRRTGSTHLREIPPKHILGPSSSSGTVITSGTSVTCSSTVASTSPPRNHSLQQQQRRRAACNNFLAKFKQAKPVKETPSKNRTKSHSSRSMKKLLSPPQVESKATVGSFNLPTKVDLQEKKGSHYHAEHDPYYYLPTTETRSSSTLTPRRSVTLSSSRRTSKLDAYIQEITVQPNCNRDDDDDDSLKTSTTTRHSRHSRGANNIYTSNPKHSSSVSKTSSVVSTISPSRLCSSIKSPAMIPLQPVSPRDSSCLRRPEFSAAPSPLSYRPPTSLLLSSLTSKTQELASVVTAVTSPMEPFVADHIQVAIRLRPLQPRELLCTSPTKRLSQFRSRQNHGRSGSCATDIDSSQEDAHAWTLLSDNSSNALLATLLQKKSARNIPGRTAFALDHVFDVFDESTTSNQVYKVFVQPIVQAVLTGRHGTVFAYGPTGSGKTYTMQGGVIPQAATDLFEQLPPGGLIRAQYFEIYNETVLDLAHGRKAAGHISKNNRRVVSVQENLSGDVQVNASYHDMHTVNDVASLLAYGNRRRACGTTDVNKESSRSHAIFRLHVHVPQRSNCPTDAVTTATTTAMLNLVDLAGSENASKSNTSGLRKREGGKINQSLPSKKQPKHIGFRDSKLTRILQSSLEGNACTAILCCASASRMSVEETRSTLKFAASAKTIVVQPTVNVQVVSQASLIDSLRKELTESRAALQSLQAQLDAANQRGCVAGEAVSAVESSNTSEQSDMAETTPMDEKRSLSQDNLYHEPSSPRSAMTTYCYHVDHDNDSESPSEAVLVDEFRLSDTFRRQSESSQTLLCQKSITLSPSRSEWQKSAFTSEPQKSVSISEPPSSFTDFVPPPVSEVVIMVTAPRIHDADAATRLEEAEERAKFLEGKLETTDNLVESLFDNLKSARCQNEELLDLNTEVESRLLNLEQAKEVKHKVNDLLMQQHLLLKYSIYLGLVLYIFGGKEYFLAVVVFIWLSLEIVA